MPYKVELVNELYRAWPPRIHNIYWGDVTTEEVISCFHETIAMLGQQTQKVDVVGVMQPDTSLANATSIIFQKDLIDEVTFHPKLDQIVIVDLNNVMTGVFLKRVLQVALSRPDLKVTILGSMDELSQYLQRKYSH